LPATRDFASIDGMATPAVIVRNLTKRFEFSIRNPQRGWLANFLTPDKKSIVAVDDISFEVPAGQRLAFIGPNGAGKSTTIKMLAGILYPTAGSVSVLGLDPSRERKKLAYKIGTVFGQRSQLLPNLPLNDSLEFFGAMYDMPSRATRTRIGELTEAFDLKEFINQPVRKLSLGQRMRGEFAASLIHSPQIVFLDEPTIGLDVVAKKSFRDLLLKANKELGTTLFLTSHDVGDIESLCERTIVINHGKLVLDLPTEKLSGEFVRQKTIELVASEAFLEFPPLPEGLSYAHQSPRRVIVKVDLKKFATQEALRLLLSFYKAEDITVTNPDLEEVIREIYERPDARS
jgi:ABC-2 type transport system ATP-binding protein